jgi:hypothetical protein
VIKSSYSSSHRLLSICCRLDTIQTEGKTAAKIKCYVMII